MPEHFCPKETRTHAERMDDLFARLPDFVQAAKHHCPAWAERLADIEPESLTSPQALAQIPVLRKPALAQAQKTTPPFGGFADQSQIQGTRYFMSPGPVWEPQPPGMDPWLAARAFFAAGIRAGDLVHNAFSYHLTPGGLILDEGARALGANIFPAGVGNTEMQVDAAAFLKPNAYAGTPDFLMTLLGHAEQTGKDLSSITKALVSGGALFPSMRQAYQERGVSVSQAFATADLGVIAYETTHEGAVCDGMVCNEDLIVEIVRPGSDKPVEPGQVGEIVVTNFNTAYPLIRFGTGDMSKFLPAPAPCGRTNQRIQGWMGRADQRTKIKGMFVDPAQIDQLIDKVPAIEQARLVVSRNGNRDVMQLQVIHQGEMDRAEIESQLQQVTKLRGEVVVVNELPNDGLVIDDQRDYDG